MDIRHGMPGSRALCTLILCGLVAGACTSSPPATPPQKPSLLDGIRKQGELVVAVPYEGRPPEGEINPSLTTYTGFEVDLVRSLADALGVQLRFAPSTADAQPVLSAGDGVHISFPQRADVPDESLSSIPYLDSEVRLIVHANSEIEKRRDVGPGPVCSTLRSQPAALRLTTSLSGNPERCLALLEARRVVGVVGYDVTLGKLAAVSEARLVFVKGSLGVAPLAAVVIPGGDELLAHLNEIIRSAQQDGRLDVWRDRWVKRFERP